MKMNKSMFLIIIIFLSISLTPCKVQTFENFLQKFSTTPTTLNARLINVQCNQGFVSIRGRCRKIVSFNNGKVRLFKSIKRKKNNVSLKYKQETNLT